MSKFLRGFVYAFRGLVTCISEERNFRFHLAVAFHLFIYLPFFKLTRAELCAIIMLCGTVISLEAVNTAVERAVDSGGNYNRAAGAAKDAAAGAVLVAAIVSVVCGVILLWQPEAFRAIAVFFSMHPSTVIIQGALLAIGYWFVFVWHRR